jgi:PAS domain S-box-containing protein
MTSNTRRRSPREIKEELTRLQETSSGDRDRTSLLHEISVYEEELTVQNEELTRAQAALEETRDRFIELYDFAPNAYLTLDSHGVIRQCNLTAAALIGKSKQGLEGMPFLGFVDVPYRAAYFAFLRRCRLGSSDVATDLAIRTEDGLRHVEVLCRPRRGRDGSHESFTALVDVTERKLLEREREQIVRERAALTSRLLAIQEDERLRIARNLHDDLGQQVTALRLKVEEIASAPLSDGSEDAIGKIREMLHEFDRRLHFVASELRPAALDLGIVTTLAQFVREWSATFGVQATFHSAGIDRGTLAAQVETHLYRIAQEALNNTAKYAAASQATVLLTRRDDGIVLMIEDDGCGFDLEAARRSGQCLGLLGMRERAQIVGGRLEVETGPGSGTAVFVHVPPAATA